MGFVGVLFVFFFLHEFKSLSFSSSLHLRPWMFLKLVSFRTDTKHQGISLKAFKRSSLQRIRFLSSPGYSICCKALACYKVQETEV